MMAIPTMEEEDAKRPSRERECLVNERSRIINRMKSALTRLGVRGFKPHLRRAPERLPGLRTAEGTGLPANILEELQRDMARLALVREQINAIEKTREARLERAPDTGSHAMVRLLARVIGIGIENSFSRRLIASNCISIENRFGTYGGGAICRAGRLVILTSFQNKPPPPCSR